MLQMKKEDIESACTEEFKYSCLNSREVLMRGPHRYARSTAVNCCLLLLTYNGCVLDRALIK